MDAAAPPTRAVTRGPKHHFFGYYDKTPWDATGRYVLGVEAGFMDRAPTPEDEAVVGLIDTARGDAWAPLAATTAWHWQFGPMLQWLPAAPDRTVAFNVRREGSFGAALLDVFTREERALPLPIAALSPDKGTALSVNFSRLADMRPGYGYGGLRDPGYDGPHPADDGVFRMDLATGESELIVSLDRAAALNRRPDMDGCKHWFNHLVINTDGSRFAFLHRWRPPDRDARKTRLLTAGLDGSDLRCIADDDMVSHYDWRDAERILAWARQRDAGDRFFLFNERTGGREVIGEGVLTGDGHCSYSPDRRWILLDAYPDERHERALMLFDPAEGRRVDLGRFHSPPALAGPIRCDLHPRWSRDGHHVCMDSVHEGTRQIYVIDVSAIVEP